MVRKQLQKRRCYKLFIENEHMEKVTMTFPPCSNINQSSSLSFYIQEKKYKTFGLGTEGIEKKTCSVPKFICAIQYVSTGNIQNATHFFLCSTNTYRVPEVKLLQDWLFVATYIWANVILFLLSDSIQRLRTRREEKK